MIIGTTKENSMTDKKTKVKKAKKDTDLKAKIKQMEATKR